MPAVNKVPTIVLFPIDGQPKTRNQRESSTDCLKECGVLWLRTAKVSLGTDWENRDKHRQGSHQIQDTHYQEYPSCDNIAKIEENIVNEFGAKMLKILTHRFLWNKTMIMQVLTTNMMRISLTPSIQSIAATLSRTMSGKGPTVRSGTRSWVIAKLRVERKKLIHKMMKAEKGSFMITGN